VGLKIIETLGDEEENIEDVITDASKKEEDQEIDIESYATENTPDAPSREAPAEADEEDELPVDVDKVYGDAP
jgi:small subunit ribosomal protein S2